MPDKEPQFTVTDRRKFTLEGDLRDDESSRADSAGAAAGASPSAPPTPTAGQSSAPATAAGQTPVPPPQTAQAPAAEAPSTETPGDTEESAQQHYHATTRQIDDFLREANPGEAAEPANFARLVQSLYVTAMIQLGAGGDPNEKARVDLMGARESIDMMGVLGEKTKGNLTEGEQSLLQNALFELRMAFLETTNAIASAAQKQPGKAR